VNWKLESFNDSGKKGERLDNPELIKRFLQHRLREILSFYIDVKSFF